MKRHLLLVLTLAVLLPTLAVLVMAGIGIVQHEKAMERVTESYVEDLVENVAAKLDAEKDPWGLGLSVSLLFENMRIFSWGPSLPGWVAVVDPSGQALVASPGSEAISRIWHDRIPVGRAVRIKGRGGDNYTIAVYPVRGGKLFVVGAVAWDQLLGPMVRFGHLWAIMLALMASAGFIAFMGLWKWLIRPLKSLSDEVSSMKWGRDLPEAEDPTAVFEIGRLRRVLHDLARTAISRVELWNRYLQDLVKVQEEEKSRLAREIHDGPVQEVTALIQRLKLARMDTGEAREKNLNLAEEVGKDTVRELRELCNQLSPPWLDLGLSHALTELSDRLSRHLDAEVLVDVEESIDLPHEVILAFFRVFQEAAYNAVRHGRAKTIHGTVSCGEGQVWMEIHDDGSGFEPPEDLESLESLRIEGHRGLANMRERIMLIGGRLDILSSSTEGTTVRCIVPVKKMC